MYKLPDERGMYDLVMNMLELRMKLGGEMSVLYLMGQPDLVRL